MFTINDVVSALKDCEAIVSSSILEPNERRDLIQAVLARLPDPEFSSTPDATRCAQGALRRLLASCEAEAPRRKAQGIEEQAEVAHPASPAASEGTQARETERVEEQAKDPGSVRRKKPNSNHRNPTSQT